MRTAPINLWRLWTIFLCLDYRRSNRRIRCQPSLLKQKRPAFKFRRRILCFSVFSAIFIFSPEKLKRGMRNWMNEVPLFQQMKCIGWILRMRGSTTVQNFALFPPFFILHWHSKNRICWITYYNTTFDQLFENMCTVRTIPKYVSFDEYRNNVWSDESNDQPFVQKY